MTTDSASTASPAPYRLTGQRLAVQEAIDAIPGSFSIEDLCEAVPGVGRATVFRTVKLLQEQGAICRLPLEDGGIRYQRSLDEHHHHLICRRCGSVTDFSDSALDGLITARATHSGFQLASHSVELYGSCERCTQAHESGTVAGA
jgi:Fur family ferric uptake transcriptional regulator